MKGLDTNVLLRLFTADNPDQRQAVLRLLDSSEPESLRVDAVVLAELAWVLTARYRLPSQDLADVVERLLERVELVLDDRAAVFTAVRMLRSGKAGFADYLLAARNRNAGAEPTLTFDQDAGANVLFELISP